MANDLVPIGTVAPPTVAERLTQRFYAWERRGRGWVVWNGQVALEPLFEPFDGHILPAGSFADDAQHETGLSTLSKRFWDRILGAKPAPASVAPAAEPEFVVDAPAAEDDPAGLVELQVALPPTLAVPRAIAERFLNNLASCAYPVSFELIGTPELIRVQFTSRRSDRGHVQQQLRAHFPDIAITAAEDALARLWFAGDANRYSALVEFGLAHEFMRPLVGSRVFEVDPLVGMVGALTELQAGEIAVVQTLFQHARAPWAGSILSAVTDNRGGPFFTNAPEMLPLAREKVKRPLFAALVRVGIQSPDEERVWEIGRALGGTLTQFGEPSSNQLIPLSNDCYDEEYHLFDLLNRSTRRGGMLLNSDELVAFVHLPSPAVRAEKFVREVKRTKAAPALVTGHTLMLGENVHAGRKTAVTLSPEHRIRHMHVIGASGTGKSTLLLQLIAQDLASGEGVGVLDPHGDLIDQVLTLIPEHRVKDVVLLDPSDEEFPVGFNILSAHSAVEQNLLASDLVAVFRRLSTSWGDQMNSVLGNAILAFLESERGGTLLDLRRFLVEKDFRQEFLASVKDPQVVYYWQKEFPLLAGKPQAPLLTRLDIFLRPKLVRAMVAQRENRIDFARIMNEGKILLAKLAQGAIGEENAYLLGALLVSKFHQLALSRQELAAATRRPFYLYIDEFHHFATPSMAAVLSGARKYGLGLCLAHQDLRQLGDSDVASAVLTNAGTRICFRVNETDARKLSDGFASFDAKDFQNLGVGEALCRVERAEHDFNLATAPFTPVDATVAEARRTAVLTHSRGAYARPRAEVEALMQREFETLSNPPAFAARAAPPEPTPPSPPTPEAPLPPPVAEEGPSLPRAPAATPRQRATVPAPAPAPPIAGRGGAQHRYLQSFIQSWAKGRGYGVSIEHGILDGLGSVDVVLAKGDQRIACEISITTSPEHELGNVQKCLAAGFVHVAVVSPERRVLKKIQAAVTATLLPAECARVRYCTLEELFAFLEELEAQAVSTEGVVRGYKVKATYKPVSDTERQTKTKAIAKVVVDTFKKLKRE
jgi:hypothetical protein